MRILVVGAGAIGGYFGGRLVQAGRDVTFLVRERRERQLQQQGLVVRSPKGDIHVQNPRCVRSGDLKPDYDLILLSCKAYDLEEAVQSIAPSVGPSTAVLPLLNGMRHIDVLESRFGPDRVLGGLCVISTTLDEEGRILHLNDLHALAFGERTGKRSARIERIDAALRNANFDSRLSPDITLEMWEKWVFISTAAGITCLMRASVGDIVAAGGADLATGLLDECSAIAAQNGVTLTESSLQRSRGFLTAEHSPMKASMLRDIERGARTEGDHILGDLLRRAGQATGNSLLRIAYTHLKAYEAVRAAG
jgi:2-dehydropantoate 2-reductase